MDYRTTGLRDNGLAVFRASRLKAEKQKLGKQKAEMMRDYKSWTT